MTKIKICGITNMIDALAAAELGVDMLGFVFYNKSKRYVEAKTVRGIVNELPGSILKVGVFVNEERDKVLDIAADLSLDILQLHGDETPEYCALLKGEYKVMKAFRIKDKTSLRSVNDYIVDYYLFDTYQKSSAGGTGEIFDWELLKDFEVLKPFILSGGLDPDNVGKAILEVAPYGVDVSSGIESSPGKKDIGLLKKFVTNLRRLD
ncbi:MAG: phosphoribosylanthranilate isomerase [Candidatus Omnitrophica bacterium]|nr:phosphoribosylanthranilate isomerase [Candidatus Omnitrophota bacterium]